MDTLLVIDNEDAIGLASSLAALTGKSVSASIVAALSESLERDRTARGREDARKLSRAIAANIRQEGRHLACVPDHGWCRLADGLPR